MTCEISAFIVHKLIRTGEEKNLKRRREGHFLKLMIQFNA